MVLASIFRWFNQPSTRRKGFAFRPAFLVLEDRLTPADLTWVGAAGAGWDAAANWSPAQVPVNGDTLIFNGTQGVGANTNSNMNLGGGVQYHIGKLAIASSYTQTITLGANLRVDVLDMDGGTIAGDKFLDIY